MSSMGEEKADRPKTAMSRYPPAPGSTCACLSRAVPAPVQSKSLILSEIWRKSFKSRIYRAPGQNFEQRTGAENGSRKRHCDVPLPKRCSQDPNFHFTLPCCNQRIKRYQTSRAKTKCASNSCVRGPGSKYLALKTSHQDIQKLIKPTSRWTSSGYPLTVEWRRRMGLCPYSPDPEVKQCCISNLCSWLP